jgi:hypothetical protein
MSYQEKYFKYKNKYLDLKSKLNKMEENNFSEQSSIFLNPKDNNLIGGSQLNTTEKTENNQLNTTEKTENNQLSSDTITSLFNQTGGRGNSKEKGKKKMKGSKQFIHNISDSDLVSSSTISSNSDSDFLSSEIEF